MQRFLQAYRIIFLYILCAAAPLLHAQPSFDAMHDGAEKLVFVENRGQITDMKGGTRPDIAYSLHAGAVQLYFSGRGVSYVFRTFEPMATRANARILGADTPLSPVRMKGYRMDLDLIGASTQVDIQADRPASYRNHYYRGKSLQGIRNVRSFRRLTYREVYPNIDLVFSIGPEGLKYDFIVHPGGRVADIRLRYAAGSVAVAPNGTLRASTPLGDIREEKPVTWQQVARGENVPRDIDTLESAWQLSDGELGFKVAPYDSTRTLVIDPGVSWSTYCGGSGYEEGNGVTTDISGNVYVIGYTASSDFPVSTGAFQSQFKGGEATGLNSDAFVMKYNRDGQRLWATYVGGDRDEVANAVSIDRRGNLVVCGVTESRNFPVSNNAFQNIIKDVTTDSGGDAFLMKMDADGQMLWSTYYGGGSRDAGFGVAVDSTDSIVMVGGASSIDFPVSSDALQPSSGGVPGRTTYGDMFITRFGPDGSRTWATYFGGNSGEVAKSVAIDPTGTIFVAGYTGGGTFPTTPGALQTAVRGPNDAVIVSLGSDGSLRWSTVYGGGDVDQANGITVTDAGEPVVIGSTQSPDFVTTNGSNYSGTFDVFVMKLDSTGKRLWSLLHGGLGGEEGKGIAYDRLKNMVAVTGYTNSTVASGFHVTGDAPQKSTGGSNDGFVLQFDADGGLFWGTFLGGAGFDVANAVSVDDAGNILVAGLTGSANFPTAGTVDQTTLNGQRDAFITRYGCDLTAEIAITGDTAACTSVPAKLEAPSGYTYYRWSNGANTRINSIKAPGVYFVIVGDATGCSGKSKPFLVRPAVTVRIDAPDSVVLCQGDTITLGVVGNYASYIWSNGDMGPFTTVYEPGPYTVTVVDTGGCSGTSMPVTVTFHQLAAPPTVEQCGFTLTASPAVAYQWFIDDQVIQGAVDRDFTAPGFGFYSVRITDTNGCRAMSAPYDLAPENISSTVLSLPPDYTTQPGEIIAIPILLDSSHLLDPGPQEFTVLLRYNQRMLFPADTGATPVVAPDGTRMMSFTRRWSGSGDTLTTLRFVTLLGDSDITPVGIDTFIWHTRCPVMVSHDKGATVMVGLCQQGGARMVRQGLEPGLKPVYPNPVQNQVQVDYALVEHGATTLYLVNESGQRVATLVDRYASPGSYASLLDVRTLAAGIYYCVLETPTQRFTRPIVVGR